MENLKYNPGKGYKMVKRGGGGGRGGRVGRYFRAAGAVASGAYNAMRRNIGPQLPGGAFRSKHAAKMLARAALSQRQPQRRKSVSKVVNLRPTPGLTSNSRFRLSRMPSPQVKAMKRVGAPNYWIINDAQQVIAAEGFQNAYAFPWNSQYDIQQMTLKVPLGTTPVPGTYRTNRWVLGSLQSELLITNSSLASCYVELYDIVRKKDANQTEFAFTADPLGAWRQGEYNASQVSIDDWKIMNARPFDSQVFREFFKVVKRTRIELSQGACHRHAVNLSPNKLINAAKPEFTDGDYAGLTCYTMVVFKGQPASVPTEAGAVVTTASIALDFVSTKRYKWTWVSDTSESAYLTDNLSTLKGEQVVSTGAGAIVPNAIV